MKILINGCSFIRGYGLENEDQNPKHFLNLLLNNNSNINSLEITNISINGNSNENIFLTSTEHLTKNHYDLAIVGLTSGPRFMFYPDFGEQPVFIGPTNTMFGRDTPVKKWSVKETSQLREWLMLINHRHHEVLKILRYSATLESIATQKNCKIIFVNSLCPWNPGYFSPEMPSTEILNDICEVHPTDQEQQEFLFRYLQQQYESTGVNKELWLNFNQSLMNLKIDTITQDNRHPGIESHRLFFNLFADKFNSLVG